MKRLLLALTVVGLAFFLAAPTAVVAQELTADDYIEFWTPNVGTWKGTFEIDGQTRPITFRFRISPNKKCILPYDDSEECRGRSNFRCTTRWRSTRLRGALTRTGSGRSRQS